MFYVVNGTIDWLIDYVTTEGNWRSVAKAGVRALTQIQ